MRFEGLLERHERSELSQEEAAEMLGVSERTFPAPARSAADEGPEGLRDRRIGKPSSRRAGPRRSCACWGSTRSAMRASREAFSRVAAERHDYKLGYTVTRLALQGAGLVRPAPRRSAHRKKRPRRPMVGMMLQQDASRFAWLPGDDRQYDLVVTFDDATSAIYSGLSSRRMATGSSFRALAEVIDKHGLFRELYPDRRQPLFPYAQGRGGGVDGRANAGRAPPGAARHPPHRGLFARGARPFRARLPHFAGPPAEGAGAGRITTLAAANRWLAESYWPAHNAAFAVAAAEAGSAFILDRTGRVRDILCLQEKCRVGMTTPSSGVV